MAATPAARLTPVGLPAGPFPPVAIAFRLAAAHAPAELAEALRVALERLHPGWADPAVGDELAAEWEDVVSAAAALTQELPGLLARTAELAEPARDEPPDRVGHGLSAADLGVRVGPLSRAA